MIIALKNSLKVAIAIAIILAAFAAISPVVSSAPAVAAPSWCADPPCPASSRPTVPSAPRVTQRQTNRGTLRNRLRRSVVVETPDAGLAGSRGTEQAPWRMWAPVRQPLASPFLPLLFFGRETAAYFWTKRRFS